MSFLTFWFPSELSWGWGRQRAVGGQGGKSLRLLVCEATAPRGCPWPSSPQAPSRAVWVSSFSLPSPLCLHHLTEGSWSPRHQQQEEHKANEHGTGIPWTYIFCAEIKLDHDVSHGKHSAAFLWCAEAPCRVSVTLGKRRTHRQWEKQTWICHGKCWERFLWVTGDQVGEYMPAFSPVWCFEFSVKQPSVGK